MYPYFGIPAISNVIFNYPKIILIKDFCGKWDRLDLNIP